MKSSRVTAFPRDISCGIVVIVTVTTEIPADSRARAQARGERSSSYEAQAPAI